MIFILRGYNIFGIYSPKKFVKTEKIITLLLSLQNYHNRYFHHRQSFHYFSLYKFDYNNKRIQFAFYSSMSTKKQPDWLDPATNNEETAYTSTNTLEVYNSLTRCKVKFTPKKEKYIKWYNCGPTVYDSAHIGHARYETNN